MQCGVVVPASSEMKRFSNLFEDFVFLCFLSKVTRHAWMKCKCASAWWDARASSKMKRFSNLFEDFVFFDFLSKATKHACMKCKCARASRDARASSETKRLFSKSV